MDDEARPACIPSNIEEPADACERTESGVWVVGVGASAGGLGAFRLLLGALPADTGFAIVLIQHLDPTHQSSLSEILRRSTAMPVVDADQGMPVEPNHVYVIRPNTGLTIADRVLRLTIRDRTTEPHMPIDHFFRSLARDCRSRAVGVILSGTGSDGALGMQAVKEAGGITFAQDPATAEFGGMPRMAAAATGVDFVLPPGEIALELARISRHPGFAMAQPEAAANSPQAGEPALDEVLAVMRDSTGIDFSLYREKTIRRRVMRRVALRSFSSLQDYVKLLQSDPGERSVLQGDLLINVTRFFRDPDSFAALARLVFPEIVRGRPKDDCIRIWVPGCATGEEAYSIAISLQEYMEATGAAFPVQIFASDVSEVSVEKARSGLYLENITSDVSQERLNRYFARVEGGYQVGKAIRAVCVFSRHNLIDDPPFGRLDLISCRNVLIYLGAVQKSIIPLFHYALKPTGFLMLGQSETAAFEGLFSLIDRDHRIYARREVAGKTLGRHLRASAPGWSADAAKTEPRARIAEFPGADRAEAVDRILLSKYRPAGMLVDAALEVLEIRGDVTPFFRLPEGKTSFHLLKLTPDTGLFLEMEKLIHEASEKGETVSRARVPYERDGAIHEVNIEATPLSGDPRSPVFVLFDPALAQREAASGSPEKPAAREEEIADRDRQIAKLRLEVAEARQRLLCLAEEHEISNEESQSANEEALSANEELQSLNEEMETAKEELQSTNEELISLNQQLESRNSNLTDSRDEAQVELRRAQDALRRAETMEAVGRLAGGIAHDFNNVLTAVVGYAHLVADSIGSDHEAIDYVHEIESAGQRAAVLVDQLLAFSRRKVMQPKVFSLNAVVGDIESLLRRVMGEQIKIVVRAAADLWRVSADPGEIGRALMNLCLNARDAMPAGGMLIIQTANVTIVEPEAGLRNLAAGQYVELTVRDTGIGMEPDVLSHVFEPFFTTKETGKGTGLGLATVLGIVEQSGGAIWCRSEPGRGSAFTTLLPAVEAMADLDAPPAAAGLFEAPRGSAEVILLVEDEDRVRKLASRILHGLGYVVLQAKDGREGLSVWKKHRGEIDLLLSDVLMPGLGGRELAEQILALNPDMKVLFMSGHTLDVILKEGIRAGVPFLRKPFVPAELARRIREVLDSRGRTRGIGRV
jgi:two-component system CheB/CheR fusion protein